MYAITANGWREVVPGMTINANETVVEALPQSLITQIKKIEGKRMREDLLRSSDWTQLGDSKVTGQEKAAWQLYRQALRDLTSLTTWPDITWPTPPPLNPEAAYDIPKQVVS